MLVAFSVTPIGAGEDVGELVAEAVRVVRASGLPNRTDAMFTMIEGEWDEVMAVVKAAMDAVLAVAPHARGAHHVEYAGLVLQAQERDPGRRRRSLPVRDHAADEHPGAAVHGGQL